MMLHTNFKLPEVLNRGSLISCSKPFVRVCVDINILLNFGIRFWRYGSANRDINLMSSFFSHGEKPSSFTKLLPTETQQEKKKEKPDFSGNISHHQHLLLPNPIITRSRTPCYPLPSSPSVSDNKNHSDRYILYFFKKKKEKSGGWRRKVMKSIPTHLFMGNLNPNYLLYFPFLDFSHPPELSRKKKKGYNERNRGGEGVRVKNLYLLGNLLLPDFISL